MVLQKQWCGIIMEKIMYKLKIYKLLNHENKFKQLTSDPAKLR